MRLLTPSEQREIEHIKNALRTVSNIEINESNRDMWLNALEMVLQTQEAMKAAWRSSMNPQIDFIQATKQEIE